MTLLRLIQVGLLIITKHELLHKVSGGSFNKIESDAEDQTIAVRRVRAGFSNTSIRLRSLHKRGITEAVNEHITLGCESGDFATLDSEERLDEVEGYWMERKLLAIFIERSGGLVNLKAICRASFEDNDNFVNRRLMVAQAREAFGDGAYNKLEMLMELVGDVDEIDKGMIAELADRIHPPEINDDGTVRHIGWIDVDRHAEAA